MVCCVEAASAGEATPTLAALSKATTTITTPSAFF
jgi:hypothetical protein